MLKTDKIGGQLGQGESQDKVMGDKQKGDVQTVPV